VLELAVGAREGAVKRGPKTKTRNPEVPGVRTSGLNVFAPRW
jgi:hypothetical protein